MDVNEYISSGILESYALGLVSAQERKEVECMSHIYPEIKEELDRICLAMEEMAKAQSVAPPPALKTKIFAQLSGEKAPEQTNKEEARVVSLHASRKTIVQMRWLAAACFIGLLAVGALYMMERSNTGNLHQQLAQVQKDLEQSKTADQAIIEQMKRDKTRTDAELAMFRNPAFKTVFLKGTPAKPHESLAIVCVNTSKGETVMAVENLPQTPDDKQYQLWALVNGTPVDMGVLPKDSVANGSFFKVKNVEGAQAFAITMEKAGGSPNPTLEEMYVMGVL